jgi:hypothetical protein
MLTDNAAAPLTPPHAVVPHGQMPGDATEHAVIPPADDASDSALQPPSIEKLKKMFDEARNLTNEARTEQEKDQDYYDTHGQATAEIRHVLKARGQPLVIDNRIAPAIDGILGVLESGKTDPRAFPRNPGAQAAADVATKMLRYVSDKARWTKTRMDCASDYLIHGITAAIVEYDGADVRVNQGRWETFFYDPKSRDPDFADAKYMGFATWMYADEVAANPEWAERVRAMGDITTVADTALEATWDDKPESRIMWVDRRRNRVLVVEIYYRAAQGWLRAVYCAAGTLEFGPSPYRDVRTGATRCPIEAQSFKVDRQNNRYGPIRSMRYMQDEVNARRSRGLHLLNSRQIQQVDPGTPPVDADTARVEMARADGVVPPGYQAVPTTDIASGNLAMLAEAKESLQRMVPVAIAQDLREGSAASGRARQVAQQAGLTQFGRGFGQFADFEERVYRQMWQCAQQFKRDPEWIRITDNPRAVEFLQINEVVGYQPAIGPDGQPVMQPVVNNRPAEMDMDIIIATTPDTVALEQEVFEAVMQLIQSGIDPLSPVFEVVLELAPLPDKTRLLERVKALKEQVQQQQAQQMQQQTALQGAMAQAELEEKQAGTVQKLASAHNTAADADTKQAQLYANLGIDPRLALAPEQPLAGQADMGYSEGIPAAGV